MIGSLLLTGFLISQFIEQRTYDQIELRANNIADVVSLSELISRELATRNEDNKIQAYAEVIRKETGVDFVVVLDMDRLRQSHPNPSLVGETFQGNDEEAVLQGENYVSIGEGSLGFSLRSFSPIFYDETQVGAVAVGILLDEVEREVRIGHIIIITGLLIGLLAGIIGAYILGRKIKRIMFGLEPDEIAKILGERNSLIQSVKEGIIAINKDGTVSLVNSEAYTLLKKTGFKDNPVGEDIEKVLPRSRLKTVLHSGKRELDEEFSFPEVSILVNRVPIMVKGEIIGAVATFRDKTEVQRLAEELTGVKTYAEALRAKSHEFKNKLQVIMAMLHLESYDELKHYMKKEITDHDQELEFIKKKIYDPVIAAVLTGKLSYARENGVKMILSDETYVPESKTPEIAHKLVSIIGNLVDNAIEANSDEIYVELVYEHFEMEIVVSDNGTGIPDEIHNRVLERGITTKGEHRGFGLPIVNSNIQSMDGTISIRSSEEGTSFYVKIPYVVKEDQHDSYTNR
ncbi:DcuS/MalK family sensor histidine kinase [Salisediminibacterium beveridgei]|uniref:histidine kinase n=1 Tax=Salisediminibacterium beveridgei TaxID=632773 RepID=A0A1D7QX27_9BACI|nr:DcuS/MalK family sensor histidine kinase [Salisediminibacterium beveridgei]AOM83567.1 Two-component sensor histidine kinase, malate [Salisediminibacterium beveridgei]